MEIMIVIAAAAFLIWRELRRTARVKRIAEVI
jgi:hypothetical protein